MLDRKGLFTKLYVVKLGWSMEYERTYKTFATKESAFEYASRNFAKVLDVRIEYKQIHSIMNEFAEVTN